MGFKGGLINRGAHIQGGYTQTWKAPVSLLEPVQLSFLATILRFEKIEFGGLIILSVQLLLLSRSSVQRQV